jgi:predicted dithiol-disulfide oxidoreductase (DUF899 family)
MNMTLDEKVVSKEQWLAARKALLQEEKELTRRRDALARRRMELPWTKVEKSYVFEGPHGKTVLAELFGGKSQLFVYHFMFGPDWQEGCPSCSMIADHFDGSAVHLAQRDVSLMAISRAPITKLEAFKKRMGWKFNWVSSHGNDFNRDFGVQFSKDELAGDKFYNFGTGNYPVEEAHGVSVFYKDDAGEIFHTYSTYARGCEELLGVYAILDWMPKGRDEEGMAPHPMGWVRHHDKYESVKKGSACGCS